MSDIKEELKRLQKQEIEIKQKLEALTYLSETYPDLRIYVGRWRKVYCAVSVNRCVTDCDIRHSCGCCPDSSLEIWPYFETKHGKVYSDPPRFIVGEKDDNCYDQPHNGWAKKIQSEGVSEEVISAVGAYFKKQRDERRAELREELDRLEECPECEGDEYLQPCGICGVGK